jgi:phospholipid/cholesterol/gamma-HCH transport system substrate-binding protein
MKRTRVDVIVGAFVLVACAILLWGSIQLGVPKGWAGGGGRKVVARFRDVAGLRERTPVLVAGVRVGEVERLGLDGNTARVTLRIEEDSLRIPIDTLVAVRSQGFLGDKVIELRPGRSTELLEEGGFLTRTRDAPDIDRLVERFGKIVEDVQAVSTTFRNVLGTAEGEESLRQALANVEEVSGDLRRVVKDNEARIDRVISSFETFSSDLEKFTTESSEPLAQVVGNLKEASESLRASFAGVAQVLEKVQRGEGTLGKVVSDEGLYTELDSALAEARSALRELRRAAEETQEQVPATILTTVLGTLF